MSDWTERPIFLFLTSVLLEVGTEAESLNAARPSLLRPYIINSQSPAHFQTPNKSGVRQQGCNKWPQDFVELKGTAE